MAEILPYSFAALFDFTNFVSIDSAAEKAEKFVTVVDTVYKKINQKVIYHLFWNCGLVFLYSDITEFDLNPVQ